MTLSWQIHHLAMDNYHLQLARIPLSKWVEYIYREYHFYMIIGAIYCIIYTYIYMEYKRLTKWDAHPSMSFCVETSMFKWWKNARLPEGTDFTEDRHDDALADLIIHINEGWDITAIFMEIQRNSKVTLPQEQGHAGLFGRRPLL